MAISQVSASAAPSKVGLGELSRSGGIVAYKPMKLSKELLQAFLREKVTRATRVSEAVDFPGFIEWLERRAQDRRETKARVSSWQVRKSRVAAARRAVGSEVFAVLCLDSGGMEAHSGGAAPTLDAHLRSLVRYHG